MTIIEILNKNLIDEHTAIAQYRLNAEINKHLGFNQLYAYFIERKNDEKKHAEMLIKRILFLTGIPEMSIKEIKISNELIGQLNNDLKIENQAVVSYRDAIKECLLIGDSATRIMLEEIEAEEEEHIHEIQQYLEQIELMGIDNFLSSKIGG